MRLHMRTRFYYFKKKLVMNFHTVVGKKNYLKNPVPVRQRILPPKKMC